jgi:zinc transport system permease protein
MLEFLQYDFMVRALLVGFFTAISTAILGNFVVTARQAIVSDMLAHTALVGVGIGIFWQVSPTYLSLVTTIIAGVFLWWLGRKNNQAPEAISMLLLTGGLALALLLAHINKDNPISLDTYLFGSILTVTAAEMTTFIVLNICILIIVLVCWRPFLIYAFDRDFSQTLSKTVLYEILFIVLLSLIVGIGLKVIGGLLIGALLVIPVLIAQTFTQSFKQNVVYSVLCNILAVVAGIISSFYLDIPVSSGIVLSLIALYILTKTSFAAYGMSIKNRLL